MLSFFALVDTGTWKLCATSDLLLPFTQTTYALASHMLYLHQALQWYFPKECINSSSVIEILEKWEIIINDWRVIFNHGIKVSEDNGLLFRVCKQQQDRGFRSGLLTGSRYLLQKTTPCIHLSSQLFRSKGWVHTHGSLLPTRTLACRWLLCIAFPGRVCELQGHGKCGGVIYCGGKRRIFPVSWHTPPLIISPVLIMTGHV